MSKTRGSRFATERARGYHPKEGSLESALAIVKEVFPYETTDGEADGWWIDREERATITPGEACFQYYLAGKGHVGLAELLVDEFPQTRGLPSTERDELVKRVADSVYDHYPPKYKERLPR